MKPLLKIIPEAKPTITPPINDISNKLSFSICIKSPTLEVNFTIIGNSIDSYNRGSCQDWMHNYLYQSKTYGGSYEDNTINETGVYNYNYWIMSTNSIWNYSAWFVGRVGDIGYYYVSDSNNGARAVIQIDK